MGLLRPPIYQPPRLVCQSPDRVAAHVSSQGVVMRLYRYGMLILGTLSVPIVVTLIAWMPCPGRPVAHVLPQGVVTAQCRSGMRPTEAHSTPIVAILI